jgi:hypothetical protein
MTALGLQASTRLGLNPRGKGRGQQNNAFAPDTLGGLAYWYDAANSPVVQSGGVVERWDDLSGNANHAAQSTSAARPLKTTDAAARPLIRFDGTDDALLVIPRSKRRFIAPVR